MLTDRIVALTHSAQNNVSIFLLPKLGSRKGFTCRIFSGHVRVIMDCKDDYKEN
jgi:hypothetical protein